MDIRYLHLKHCRHLLLRSRLSDVKKLRLETQLFRISWLLLSKEDCELDDEAGTDEAFRNLARETVKLCNSCHDDYLYDSLFSKLNEVVVMLSATDAEAITRHRLLRPLRKIADQGQQT